MVRLIQKSGFIKPGRAAGYIKYIATRDGAEMISPGPEGYLEYMATRPGAERHGEHGLFSSRPVSLSSAMKAAQEHTGPIWTFIYFLRREDAARLGFDSAEGWQSLLKAHQVELASAMKIPPEQFRWYAAYHDAGEHPHIHMTAWSDDPSQGYLTKDGIKAMRSTLTNSIFQDDLYSLYQRKDISYKELVAKLYLSGKEIEQNRETAVKWFTTAANQGHK